ncbi:protein MNN4 [Morus notabilis]|uniref:protein MNN4 n=1 Tax=Morus notabilis TaxID=981085 RepID=UPI000CED5419|nr:protein MNN4 [Morus notabilis]
MFRARESWFRALNRFKTRSFSGKPTATGSSSTNNGNGSEKAESSLTKYDETYRQLDNLDFTAAAKILFTHPPKKRKFGIDFHLVQLFFALMPSFGITFYQLKQKSSLKKKKKNHYGKSSFVFVMLDRHKLPLRELEQKKKKEEEEEKAKELELKATQEKEAESVPELLEVKTRLEKLEETLKEIVIESKKQSSTGVVKEQQNGNEKKHLAAETSSRDSRSESNESKEKDRLSGQKSAQGQKDSNQRGGISQDDKR